MKTILTGSIAGLGFGLAAMNALAAPHGAGEGRFDRLDINGDGEVTRQEMDTRQAEFMVEADSDGDGAVSRDEAKAFREAKRAEMRAKRNPDKNSDGVVDRNEFMNAAEERFERMDKNGNGVIDEDEQRRRRGRR